MARIWISDLAPTQQDAAASGTGTRWQLLHVNSNGYVVQRLGWYRRTVGSPAPTKLRLINNTDALTVVDAAITDNGAVGWQWSDVANAPLWTGLKYGLGVEFSTSFVWSYSSGLLVPDAPIANEQHYWANSAMGGTVGGTAAANTGAIDLQVGTAPTAGALNTVDVTTIDNELSNYLSTSDNMHHEALPWTTKVAVDQLQSEVGTPTDASTAATLFGRVAALAAKQNGTTGFDALSSAIAALQADLTALSNRVGTPPTTITGQIAGVVTSVAADITTMGTAIAGDIAGVEHHLIDAVLGQAGFPSGSPSLTWTMADEIEFDTQLAWDVPADMYLVNITATRPGLAADTFAGLPWYHRLGAWCPLNASLGSTRRFVEFASQALDDGGRRMAGLAMRCQPGTIGTVQAWTLG